MKVWVRLLPAVLWMAVIFFLSHQTGEQLDGQVLDILKNIMPFIKDLNFGHFIAYYILAICYYFALGLNGMNVKGKIFCVILCIAYGMTDEFHQSFIPGRSPDFYDIRNDAIGAALAMLTMSIPVVHRLMTRLLGGRKY